MVNWQTFLSVFATIFLAETRALKFVAGSGFIAVGVWALLAR